MAKRAPAKSKRQTKARKSSDAVDLRAKTPLEDYVASVFPIVAVGASAGGIGAFIELLEGLPERPGAAIIFLLHTDPQHSTALPDVIARATQLPVSPITDGAPIVVNRVYIAMPGTVVTVENGRFTTERAHDGSSLLPIDICLRSLADDEGSRAIGVVLSGTGSDGTAGLTAIKAEGGITFAQNEGAQFNGMPRAAIASGFVDFALPPREIAQEIVRIARHSYVSGGGAIRLPEKEMQRVFGILQATHDVDFTNYKPTTIERRIRRRMALHKIESLTDYVEFLSENRDEVEQLYSDVLIRVTGFFRDPSVFDTLKREYLPALMRERSIENPVRVWVPGCATGEEAYTLAIVLLEAASEAGLSCPFQIFGTDISEPAIDRARSGQYPEGIATELTPERLQRWFTRSDGGYRISKSVRDCCIFARQNLTKDPPFSRLDMISCRNVMIYLGTVLQRKAMSIFHYALRSSGLLILGSSETIGNFGDLFTVSDRKHKIYTKRNGRNRVNVDFESSTPRERAERQRMDEEIANPGNVFREADRVLLTRFTPPGVLINENMEILQFRGRTSPFLEPAPGAATFNVLKMAREGLLAELRAAIHSSRKIEAPVRREGVRMQYDGKAISVNIEVIPVVSPGKSHHQIVLFEQERLVEEEKPSAGTKEKKPEKESKQNARMKRELDATREYLQSIIEEQEAMNEELRSANEEIQSSNEELQSTNEELETAKEELQSSNEELTTLNEELENRNQELAEANNDLVNLLASVDIPIVMLDASLRIRRFNPGAQRTLHLIPADVGRPIGDLKSTIAVDDLDKHIAAVIDNLEVKEMEVKDHHGHWYLLRVRPYKTTENKIEGAVLVLIDINQLKKS